MGLGLRQPKSVHKTAIYGSFVGLKKVSIKLPYMAVLSTQKCVHRTAIYGSSMDTLQNCRIWQLCPSVQGDDQAHIEYVRHGLDLLQQGVDNSLGELIERDQAQDRIFIASVQVSKH